MGLEKTGMKKWGWREDEWAGGGGGRGDEGAVFQDEKWVSSYTVVSQKKFSKREGMEKLKGKNL